ncbi:MAG: rhamnulose-1-phosphate aldolase [Bacteroidetes bacterium]|nr:rhamnulose-1-phosphate aldolase [Bacteroidota bacterium]
MIKTVINEIASVAGFLWDKGWAEKNAGNISVNLTGEVEPPDPSIYSCKIARGYDSLAGNVILITASGSKMRDIKESPLRHIIILVFDESGTRFSKLKLNSKYNLFSTEDIPSSELPVHLAIHNTLTGMNSGLKTILHTHSTELITFSHLKECTSENKMNRKLREMHPEFGLFIPEGIGLIREQESANEKIAAETAEMFRTKKIVLWKKHGAIAAAETPNSAFDLIDIASKAAKIFLLSGGRITGV